MIFNGFVRIFVGLPFSDTQCGFKAFVREPSRVVFEQQRIERFGFDPEILFLAKRHGLANRGGCRSMGARSSDKSAYDPR